MKILIVDDDPVNIEALANALKDSYEILTALNGHDAISLVKERSPDLVLLDIMNDMRAPLRMIASYLQLLDMGLSDKLDAEKREYLNFAEHHAGRIWAESAGEGLGSRFTLSLPMARAQDDVRT